MSEPAKHSKYIYVYSSDDSKTEKWIKEACRALHGDYNEEGVYEGKPYFLKKEGKNTLCIFWSTYLGFDGGWYVGPTLGGSGIAWAMVDKDWPPEAGWLMKGSLPGYHVDTPLKVSEASTLRHELHVAEHCACLPCHIAEGLCIATVKGSTDNVAVLREHPRTEACCAGILTEMSCSVPLHWAFEHTIDAWYRAWFVDGFCHTASYQRAIVGAERSAHNARLHWLYHGYTSRIAEEIACHEPFALALEDLFNVHVHARRQVNSVRSHPKTRAVHEETGCHVPLYDALEHLFMPTKQNNQKGFIGILGNLALCFCCSKGEAGPAVKARDISVKASASSQSIGSNTAPAIKTRDLDLGAAATPVAVTQPTLTYMDFEKGSAERKAQVFKDLGAELEYLKQQLGEPQSGASLARVRQVEAEVQFWQDLDTKGDQMNKEKVADLQRLINLHSQRCETLEKDSGNLRSSLDAQTKQNEILQAELAALGKKGGEIQISRSLDLGAVAPAADAKMVGELRAEIEYLRQNEASQLGKMQQMEFSADEAAKVMKLKITELEATVDELDKKLRVSGPNLQQKQSENALLQAEVDELKLQLSELAPKEMEYQKKEASFLASQAAHDARVQALEQDIQRLRADESLVRTSLQNHQLSYQELDAVHKQKVQELESVMIEYKRMEAKHQAITLELERVAGAHAERGTQLQEAESRLVQLEASFAEKIQMLEGYVTTLEKEKEAGLQKNVENETLTRQITDLRLKVEEQAVKEADLQQREALLATAQPQDQGPLVEQLQNEIRLLESKVFASQQEASMLMTRMQETETVYQQKLQELEASYGKQIQAYDSQVSQQDATIQNLQQQLLAFEANANMMTQHESQAMSLQQQLQEVTLQSQADKDSFQQQLQELSMQMDTDKASLRQFEAELAEAMRIRAGHQEEIQSLILQLEASTKQSKEQADGMQDSFEGMRTGLEAAHAENVRQLQASYTEQIEQLQAAVADYQSNGAMLEERLLKYEQENQEIEAVYAQSDQFQRQVQTLEEMIAMEKESHESTKLSLAQATQATEAADGDYARATNEIQELTTTIESDRALYTSQVAELQNALATAEEENAMLKEQLAHPASPPPSQPSSVTVKTSQVAQVAYPQHVREVAQPQPHVYQMVAPRTVYVQGGHEQRQISPEKHTVRAVQEPPHYVMQEKVVVHGVPRSAPHLPVMQETIVVPTSGTLPSSGPLMPLPASPPGSGAFPLQHPSVKYQVVGEAPKYQVVGEAPKYALPSSDRNVRYSTATETIVPTYVTESVNIGT